MSTVKDKVAVVTGGSRGIGKAIVLKLASMGCHVSFNYQQSKDAAEAVAQEVEKFGVKCLVNQVDVRDQKSVKSWIEQVKKDLGQLDVLVNNAGITKDNALMMMSEEEWQEVIDTDLNGMYHVARSCIVSFMRQKSGQIINISSVSGVVGLPGQTNYSAAKGGMNAFTKALAKEVAAYGIRVNAIAPGFIETDILSQFKEEQIEEIKKQIPMERLGTVEEVAQCVAFLLSDEARYITGQIIQVDGGLAMR